MHLLQLPAEIRQKILDEVISCRTDPPQNPAASQTGRVRSAAWSGVWHLPPQNPSLNLLLVNKQINEDTKAVNKRLKTRYHVDIMFLKSCGLWPTWSVPTLPQTEYIELVEATFRIFEPTEDLDRSFQKSMSFRQGCGGPPSALWVFYRMLVALFTDGPGVLVYADSLTLEDLPPLYVVKELMIDIIEPVDTCVHSSVIFTASELDEVAQGSLISSWDVGHGPHDPNTWPEIRFANYLTEYFDHVFSISSRGNEWWAIIYECVIDRIVFRVNGTVYRVYDMEKLIAEKLTGEFYESDPDRRAVRAHNFAIWKS